MRHLAVALFRFISLVLLIAIISAGPICALAGETIRINGSGTGLEMMKPLIQAYVKSAPEVLFEMEKPLAHIKEDVVDGPLHFDHGSLLEGFLALDPRVHLSPGVDCLADLEVYPPVVLRAELHPVEDLDAVLVHLLKVHVDRSPRDRGGACLDDKPPVLLDSLSGLENLVVLRERGLQAAVEVVEPPRFRGGGRRRPSGAVSHEGAGD